jgi:hypothetical protein
VTKGNAGLILTLQLLGIRSRKEIKAGTNQNNDLGVRTDPNTCMNGFMVSGWQDIYVPPQHLIVYEISVKSKATFFHLS